MFERFTAEARAAVVGAQREARALGHGWIGTEHLLVAVLHDAGSPVAVALGGLGLTAGAVRDRVLAEVGPARFDDGEVLADVGIDLDEVRRRVEERFGPGALDRPDPRSGHRHTGWRRWVGRRHRRCDAPPPRGHIPFTRRAKKSLELALREALAGGSREIGLQHVVMGVVRAGGLATVIVSGLGVPPERVREALLNLDRAA